MDIYINWFELIWIVKVEDNGIVIVYGLEDKIYYLVIVV